MGGLYVADEMSTEVEQIKVEPGIVLPNRLVACGPVSLTEAVSPGSVLTLEHFRALRPPQ